MTPMTQGIFSLLVDTPAKYCGGDLKWGSMFWVLRRRGLTAYSMVLAVLSGSCGPGRAQRIERSSPSAERQSAGVVGKPADKRAKRPSRVEVSSHGPDRHGSVLPHACLMSLEVIGYLADLNSYVEMYSPDRSGSIDSARVLASIGESGLRLDDVNGAIEGDYERAQIEKQLVSRNGPVFVRLTHLGHIYSLPRQYSASTCHFSEEALTISLSNWYRLTFVREGADYKLRRVEYTELEGD